MSDIDNTPARHEVLSERLAFFGFTRTKVFANPIEDWELHGAQMAVVATNPDTSDYDAYCDVVERGLAPFERAYHLGQRDEATAAARRVWDLQEQFDANEALAIPEGQTRKILDALEDAAFAAGGQHLFDFDTDPVTNAGQTPWHRAGAG